MPRAHITSPSTRRTPKNPLVRGEADVKSATRTAVRAARAHLLPDLTLTLWVFAPRQLSLPLPYRGRLALVVTGMLLQDVQGFGL